MDQKLEKLKSSRYYGFVLLFVMLIFFYGVFKILTPNNFGSPANLYSYLQSSIIYAVGGFYLGSRAFKNPVRAFPHADAGLDLPSLGM